MRSTRFAALLLPTLFAPLVAGCAGPSATSAAPAPAGTVREEPAAPVGLVRMRPDRSLELTLHGAHGGRASDVRVIPPEHRDYATILADVGPMRSGDQRPLRRGVGAR